jgi:hypothetical protein
MEAILSLCLWQVDRFSAVGRPLRMEGKIFSKHLNNFFNPGNFFYISELIKIC